MEPTDTPKDTAKKPKSCADEATEAACDVVAKHTRAALTALGLDRDSAVRVGIVMLNAVARLDRDDELGLTTRFVDNLSDAVRALLNEESDEAAASPSASQP